MQVASVLPARRGVAEDCNPALVGTLPDVGVERAAIVADVRAGRAAR